MTDTTQHPTYTNVFVHEVQGLEHAQSDDGLVCVRLFHRSDEGLVYFIAQLLLTAHDARHTLPFILTEKLKLVVEKVHPSRKFAARSKVIIASGTVSSNDKPSSQLMLQESDSGREFPAGVHRVYLMTMAERERFEEGDEVIVVLSADKDPERELLNVSIVDRYRRDSQSHTYPVSLKVGYPLDGTDSKAEYDSLGAALAATSVALAKVTVDE